MQRIIIATTLLWIYLGTALSYSVAPAKLHSTLSRRQALDGLVGFGGVSLFGLVSPPAARATEKETTETVNPPPNETPEEKRARELKEKIAASKKNYRKADSYTKERFLTVDYSCVADTGSPCKDPKFLFPSDGKIEDL